MQKEIINISIQALPYPSLNEVNYIAFGDINAEYHDELYGHIESQGLLGRFKQGKAQRQYSKEWKGKISVQNITLAEYILHKIHHSENKHYLLYTSEELQKSIEEMRKFLLDSQQQNL